MPVAIMDAISLYSLIFVFGFVWNKILRILAVCVSPIIDSDIFADCKK